MSVGVQDVSDENGARFIPPTQFSESCGRVFKVAEQKTVKSPATTVLLCVRVRIRVTFPLFMAGSSART